MSRNLPPYWQRWQRAYTRQLTRDGLPIEIASPFSKSIAFARAGAARMYGRAAAEKAELQLEFFSDDTMRGLLVGSYWTYGTEDSVPWSAEALGRER